MHTPFEGIDGAAVIRGPSFALYRAPLPARFRGLVRRVTLYRSEGPLEGLMIEPAELVIPVIFSFAGTFEVAMGRDPIRQDRIGSFMAGLTLTPARIASPEAVEVLQIDLAPLGALRAFGPMLGDAREGVHQLASVGDRELGELHARMGEGADWAARLALVEGFLDRRLRAAPPSPALSRAWRLIEATGGRAPVARIASHVGWTRRHLSGQFRAFGLSPKEASRVARFSAAAARARMRDESWAELASGAGYSDQSHMAREFRQFARMSPEAWRRY